MSIPRSSIKTRFETPARMDGENDRDGTTSSRASSEPPVSMRNTASSLSLTRIFTMGTGSVWTKGTRVLSTPPSIT